MKYIQSPSAYSIIENFYTDPEKVLSLAKEFPIISCGPSKTISLAELDPIFYNELFGAILQLYGNVKPDKEYHLTSFFSKHDMHTPELLNHGWWRTAGHNPETCRYDDSAENLVYCGIIMLSKSHLDSDFEIGKVKSGLNWTKQQFIDETCNYYSIPREKYVANAITFDEYKQEYDRHENNFESVLTVKNEFNKFISWRGDVVHREKRVDTVINQYFFLSEWDKNSL